MNTTVTATVDRVNPLTTAGIIASPTIQYDQPIGPRNDILIRVEAHFERFIAFKNPVHARVLALWVLHTWVFDASHVTPYIYVSSVDPGAGKTTLMETAEDLVRNPDLSGSSSPAALYRKLATDTPTIILDEVDTIYSGAKNDDLRNVLNTGYKSNGAVDRFVNGEPTKFPTFCPKLLGGIDNGEVPATVMDRCIQIRLHKLDADTLASLNIEERDYDELIEDGSIEELQAMLRRWGTADMAQAIREQDVKSLRQEGLSARQWQISKPLIKIAQHLGFGQQAIEDFTVIFQNAKVETPETRILVAARDWFNQTGADRITNTTLAEATGYTADRVSRMLKPMGITSRTIAIGSSRVRGYYRPEFETAFGRFL